jgi:hypothetical protein
LLTAAATFNTNLASLKLQPVLALEIGTYAKVFTTKDMSIAGQFDWIVSASGLGFNVSSLDGSANMSDVTVTIQDRGNAITADMPSITLEGKTATLKTGFVGQPYADFLTLFTGQVDRVNRNQDGNSYDFVCKDTRLAMKKIIYLTGDDGVNPTSQKNTKAVVGHPLDIALDILLTQLALPGGSVDSVGFGNFRDLLFPGMIFEFHLQGAPEAKAFVESEIFKVLGGYLRITNTGVLTPVFFQPLPGAAGSVMSLGENDIIGLPDIQQADLINVLTMRFDSNDGNFNSESVQQYAASITKYGQQGQAIIESQGLRAGFQGYFVTAQVSNGIFGRFGNKNPRMDITCRWPAVLLEPGDKILVTHSKLPDRIAGTMGLVNALFEIESIQYDFEAYTVTLSLVDASYQSTFGAFRIAPDAQANWTLATAPQKARYMFQSDATGHMSDATVANLLA